jgi:thiamine-monophosphate kinase
MGVRPRFYVVALSIPSNISGRWIRAFYSGLTTLCDAFGASLIGGDLSRSPGGIHISMTILGESLNRRVTYRSGGKPGDLIYVTGSLGGACAGLHLLQRGCLQGRTAIERKALAAQRTPSPRCREGLWLSQSGFARCMMDISDGLSIDLPRMCAECGTGAEIFLSQIPVFKGSVSPGFEPLELALHGGEDFELLFCVARRKATAFDASYPADLAPATCIGRLIQGRSIVCAIRPGMKSRPLPPKGFDHFRKA